ncbi:hypothetical protein CHLRE_12g550750v5 [Chlamydomonas reinhardtii]|uniref:Succinate dehydrogenase assembly factor 2, mitochondrial n=1 Tax=Chlamydomonas reinhardtii TaxID=3055 RepID=A8IYH7_CHLRE|nr:uncharacterized protein CHLRE_12g550750v5 [Chlamydomonas reinhardtii]PNW76022.1 hypothetical protein CHLRE_12g550750v5 [Chlamydomonas reinhardtii]|eukprot:XP_001694005.1 predicted protein [Chlamydomonas reinhardtii]
MLSRAAAAAASLGLFQRLGATTVNSLASTSYSTSADTVNGQQHVSEERRRGIANKLLYRSKQRGFLELDLLMGLWAEANIPKMTMAELNQMAFVLDEENPDLFKWLTGQLQAPEHMQKNPVFVAIQSHVAQQLQDSAPPQTRAPAGRDWVRGWDDGWRGQQQKPPAEPLPKAS